MAEFRDWQGRDAPAHADLRRGVDRLIADPATEYLLGASDAGRRPEGVCQLRFRYGLWHSAEDCWLEDLFVTDSARDRGVGRALVEAAIDRARGRGCRRVDLDAASDNQAALALYGRLGFSAETRSGGRLLLLRRRLDP
jgi:GNAT superfamily N-acetyltransferase